MNISSSQPQFPIISLSLNGATPALLQARSDSDRLFQTGLFQQGALWAQKRLPGKRLPGKRLPIVCSCGSKVSAQRRRVEKVVVFVNWCFNLISYGGERGVFDMHVGVCGRILFSNDIEIDAKPRAWLTALGRKKNTAVSGHGSLPV